MAAYRWFYDSHHVISCRTYAQLSSMGYVYLFLMAMCSSVHQNYTTHSFNGPLSRTTRVGRYQKGKTNLDFTEA